MFWKKKEPVRDYCQLCEIHIEFQSMIQSLFEAIKGDSTSPRRYKDGLVCSQCHGVRQNDAKRGIKKTENRSEVPKTQVPSS